MLCSLKMPNMLHVVPDDTHGLPSLRQRNTSDGHPVNRDQTAPNQAPQTSPPGYNTTPPCRMTDHAPDGPHERFASVLNPVAGQGPTAEATQSVAWTAAFGDQYVIDLGILAPPLMDSCALSNAAMARHTPARPSTPSRLGHRRPQLLAADRAPACGGYVDVGKGTFPDMIYWQIRRSVGAPRAASEIV